MKRPKKKKKGENKDADRGHGTGNHGATQGLLPDAVVDLLRRIPERWIDYDADSLTATESNALFLLVAAGMVERRGRFRVRLHNHPLAVEGTFSATGEYGFVEAMRSVSAAMWPDWKDAYHAWLTGETRPAPTFFCESLKPDEWRLTDQGAIALADLDAGQGDGVMEFVLRRGFFDGQPRFVGGRIVRREPVRGAGLLVKMQKVPVASITLSTVNVGNWKEGADAFAAAFGAMFKAGGSGGEEKQTGGFPVAAVRKMTVNTDSVQVNAANVVKPAQAGTPPESESGGMFGGEGLAGGTPTPPESESGGGAKVSTCRGGGAEVSTCPRGRPRRRVIGPSESRGLACLSWGSYRKFGSAQMALSWQRGP